MADELHTGLYPNPFASFHADKSLVSLYFTNKYKSCEQLSCSCGSSWFSALLLVQLLFEFQLITGTSDYLVLRHN